MRWSIAGIGLLCAQTALARDYHYDVDIEDIEDLYALQSSGEIDADDAEVLLALLQHHLDLNRADREALYDLPGINYEQADAIVATRAQVGGFTSVDDLANVPGMTDALFDQIRPFVTVEQEKRVAGDSRSPFKGKGETGVLWRQGLQRNPDKVDEVIGKPESHLELSVRQGDLGAGLLLTDRTRTTAYWDKARGQLVSPGPKLTPDLEDVYVYAGFRAWRAILGSYSVGFGQRLTFDNTSHRTPRGFEENLYIYENNESGSVSSRAGLFGFAVTGEGLDIGPGWFDVTLFGSSSRQDLYQYDLWYGFDEYGGFDPFSGAAIGACQTDGDCPFDYSCGTDHQCHSSRIYNSKDPGHAAYQYLTIKNAFRENLAGGNLTYNLSQRTRLGVTAYESQIDFLVAEDAEPRFSETARYPQKSRFEAVGVDAAWGTSLFDAQGEYCRSQSKGNGAYLRIVADPAKALEVSLAGRYYDTRFENPHSRGEAAPDEVLGIRQRNERGLRLQSDWKPVIGWHVTTDIDFWETPYRMTRDANGRVVWTQAPGTESDPTHYPFQDLRVVQGVSYEPWRVLNVFARLNYSNNVLAENGRDESYQSGDLPGRGEKRQVQVGCSTTVIPGVRLSSSFDWVWEDVAKYTDRFDQAQKVRVWASAQAWPGGFLVASVSNWFHQTAVNSSGYYVDRDQPAFQGYLDWRQKLGFGFVSSLRLAAMHYRDNRPDRYPTYMLGKFSLEARW